MTLVELLMALVVLSIGIMSVAALFPPSRSLSTDGRLRTQATDFAVQKMEQLRTLTYSNADLTLGTHPAGGEYVGNNNRFQRWWVVQQFATGAHESKRVDVFVTWADTRPDTVTLTTVFKR